MTVHQSAHRLVTGLLVAVHAVGFGALTAIWLDRTGPSHILDNLAAAEPTTQGYVLAVGVLVAAPVFVTNAAFGRRPAGLLALVLAVAASAGTVARQAWPGAFAPIVAFRFAQLALAATLTNGWRLVRRIRNARTVA